MVDQIGVEWVAVQIQRSIFEPPQIPDVLQGIETAARNMGSDFEA
jgi:hypothetical protein